MKMRGFPVLAAVLPLLVLLLCLAAAAAHYAHAAPSGTAAVRLSGEVRLSQPGPPDLFRWGPQAAYNGEKREYLIVWDNGYPQDFHDIYARRLSASGELKNAFEIASGIGGDGKVRRNPALAYNAADGEYLVVYMLDHVGSSFQYEIWGRRVAWDGSWLAPEFQIFTWANRSFLRPRVAWNSKQNEYLVVANAFDTQSRLLNDVAGRRVTADGLTPYPGRNISAQDQVAQPGEAAVVYNPVKDEYLVVWRQLAGGKWAEGDIYGARLRGADSALITPLFVDLSPGYQGSPALDVNNEGGYLVAWEQAEGDPIGDRDIFARELGPEGGWRGERFEITASSDEERYPAVAINKNTGARFISWNQHGERMPEIWAINWEPASSWGGSMPRIATVTAESPLAVSTGEPGYLVVYNRIEGGGWHIDGRIYWPQAVYVPLAVVR